MPFSDWPAAALALTGLLALLVLGDAARRAGWQAPLREHLIWAGATALLAAARQMNVTLPDGLSLQYLGAAGLTVVLGYARAIVTLALIFGAEALADGGPASLPAQASRLLLLGFLPAWLIWQIARLCRFRLPPNPFVFLLGVGFLGLFGAYALSLLAATAANALLSGPAALAYAHAVLPYALLLSTGEAWLEGMMTTLLVVFAPGAVRLFDERYYLAPPR